VAPTTRRVDCGEKVRRVRSDGKEPELTVTYDDASGTSDRFLRVHPGWASR